MPSTNCFLSGKESVLKGIGQLVVVLERFEISACHMERKIRQGRDTVPYSIVILHDSIVGTVVVQ